MDFKFEQYLVLDRFVKLKDIQNSNKRNSYIYTVTGTVLYSFDEVIPLIRKKDSCLGLVKITGLFMTGDTTKVYFTVVESDKKEKYSTIYNLYRDQATANAAANPDAFGDEDQIVPGVYGNSAGDVSIKWDDDDEDELDDSNNPFNRLWLRGRDRD